MAFEHGKFLNRLRLTLMVSGLTMRGAAKEIGLSHATLSRTHGGKLPDIINYFKLTEWMDGYNAKVAEFLKTAAQQGNGN